MDEQFPTHPTIKEFLDASTKRAVTGQDAKPFPVLAGLRVNKVPETYEELIEEAVRFREEKFLLPQNCRDFLAMLALSEDRNQIVQSLPLGSEAADGSRMLLLAMMPEGE